MTSLINYKPHPSQLMEEPQPSYMRKPLQELGIGSYNKIATVSAILLIILSIVGDILGNS